MLLPPKIARSIVLGVALLAPPCLAAFGCGKSSDGPPGDLGTKKTPTEILNESRDASKAPKP